MSDRIRGQEVANFIVVGNQPVLTVTDIKSLEIEWQLEIQSEGYLGETTERKDTIFKGIRGNQEYHFENPDIFQIVFAVLDRASRRVPGLVINTKTTLNFQGRPYRLIVPNCQFGAIPMKFGSRADYGTITLPYEAELAQAA